jgi:hypothetical protein
VFCICRLYNRDKRPCKVAGRISVISGLVSAQRINVTPSGVQHLQCGLCSSRAEHTSLLTAGLIESLGLISRRVRQRELMRAEMAHVT